MSERYFGLVWWQWAVVVVWAFWGLLRFESTTLAGFAGSFTGAFLGAYIIVRLISAVLRRGNRAKGTAAN
jgi:uncharacterized membrane protein YfcA